MNNKLPAEQQLFINQYPHLFPLTHFAHNVPLSTIQELESRFNCLHNIFDINLHPILASIYKVYPNFDLTANIDKLLLYLPILPVRSKAFLTAYYQPFIEPVEEEDEPPSCDGCRHLYTGAYERPLCFLTDEVLSYYIDTLKVAPSDKCPILKE